MNGKNEKPVVFLTFANEQEHRLSYLRKLPDEYRNLRRALEQAEEKGLCQLEVRTNATIEDCVEVLRKYRNRIAVFHFGGHADGYQLLFEGEAGKTVEVDAKGFAALLGEQAGLQLVFLNACATQEQVNGLQKAGVPVVIATSCAIKDDVATDFATQFYKGMVSGAGIRSAFNEAEGAIIAERPGAARNLYRVEVAAGDRCPWVINVRPGAEATEMWNMPEAVGDPLFGLPPLPAQYLPDIPYRHLNWFTREHAEIFFGRGCQIRDLYQRVASREAAPIILFYGQSGVGKSSVLAAGLMPRLETSCGLFYARRNQEKGLLQTLCDGLTPESLEADLLEAWLASEQQLGKPFVIILDQVEEVFTRPNLDHADELPIFFEKLNAVFGDPSRRPRGKLILGFRKEWLAEIKKHLEKLRLPCSEVFLERLDRRGIIEAVKGPAQSARLKEQYGLTVESDLSEMIADYLLKDRDSPVAPSLQILLTKMWDEAKKQNWNEPNFNRNLFLELEGKGIALQDFLDQQLAALAKKQEDVVRSGLALDVLVFHTTSLGTAEVHKAGELKKEYGSKANAVEELVGRCKDLYLLTDPAQNQPQAPPASRLTHDTIAPLIRKLFNLSDKPGQRARRILENRSVEWEDNKEGNPLDEPDLKLVEGGTIGMRDWTPAEQRMVKASREERWKRVRRRRIFLALGISAIVAIVVAAGIAIRQSQQAKDQARIAFSRQLAAQAVSLINHELDLALLLSVESLQVSETTEARGSLLTMFNHAPRLKTFLTGHPEGVSSLAFSPETKILASGGRDGKVILWDLSDPRSAKQVGSPLSAHQGGVSSLAFNLESKVLASAGGFDRKIKLWDISDPHAAKQRGSPLSAHQEGVSSLAFCPESKVLASADGNGKVILWDLSDPRSAKQMGSPLSAHQEGVSSLAFNPESKVLASAGSFDRKIKLWDISDPHSAKQMGSTLSAHQEGVSSLAFNPESKVLASGGLDGKIILWDLSDPHSAKQLGSTLSAHQGGVSSLAFNPESKVLTSGGWDGKIMLWDLYDPHAAKQMGSPLSAQEQTVSSLVFNPESKVLASGGLDGKIMLWDLSDPHSAKQLGSTLSTHHGFVSSLIFNPESKVLASAGWDGKIMLWDLSDPHAAKQMGSTLSAHQRIVSSLAFSPESQVLASGGFDGKIILWDLSDPHSAKQLGSLLYAQKQTVSSLAFIPKSKVLASGASDGKIILWDLSDPHSAKQIGSTLSTHQRIVYSLAFSPESQVLASGGFDGKIILWDLSDPHSAKQMGSTLSVHQEGVSSLAFSPESQVLASGGFDGKIILWDLTDPHSAKQLGSLLYAHRGGVYSLAFSPESQVLASGGFDGKIILWDLSDPHSAKQLGSLFYAQKQTVSSLAFIPKSKVLASGASDGKIILWDLHWSSLQRRACRIANRDLTEEEWKWYLVPYHGEKSYRERCKELLREN